jgi:hypothetical protein
MRRRSLALNVHASILALASLIAAASLVGCATRSSELVVPSPIARIALLPIKAWPPSGSTGHFVAGDAGPSGHNPFPAYNAITLGLSLGYALKASRERQLSATSQALAPVSIDPQQILHKGILEGLSAAQIDFLELRTRTKQKEFGALNAQSFRQELMQSWTYRSIELATIRLDESQLTHQ